MWCSEIQQKSSLGNLGVAFAGNGGAADSWLSHLLGPQAANMLRGMRVGMFYSFCVAPSFGWLPRAFLFLGPFYWPFFVSQYLLPSAVDNTVHPQYHWILRCILAPWSHHYRSHILPSRCSNPASIWHVVLPCCSLQCLKGFTDSQLFSGFFLELVWKGYK